MAKTSLHQLDIFAQMVASGSIALCARNLGIGVEEVERDIASLEMRLGYRLFEDLVDIARLTPAGRKTAQAMTMLSQDEADNWRTYETENRAEEVRTPPATPGCQSIILAAPAPVFGHLQEALAAFEAANEDIAITLDLTVQLADEAAKAMDQGKADIAYFYSIKEPADIFSRYGWSEQINVYAGVDHPLARRENVSIHDIAITPLLAMEPQNGLRRIMEEALAGAGIERGSPVLESDNLFEIVTALREGAGCFAAFGPLARDLARMSGIRRVALETVLPAIQIRQAVRTQSPPNSAVEALAEYLFL